MLEPILGHDDHHGAHGQGERESAQCDIVQREIRVYQLVDGEWAAEGQGKHDNPEKLGGIFAFAQFVLPICLILGFATRIASLGLLGLTGLLSIYVMPEAFWTVHVYWIAILMTLITVGPGAISIDAAIKSIYKK